MRRLLMSEPSWAERYDGRMTDGEYLDDIASQVVIEIVRHRLAEGEPIREEREAKLAYDIASAMVEERRGRLPAIRP
jgi:hypothetical protein